MEGCDGFVWAIHKKELFHLKGIGYQSFFIETCSTMQYIDWHRHVVCIETFFDFCTAFVLMVQFPAFLLAPLQRIMHLTYGSWCNRRFFSPYE